VIIVDWANASLGPNYFQAAANTRLIGRIIALLLDGMRERWHISLIDGVTLVGFRQVR
jgi:hypothetical protein